MPGALEGLHLPQGALRGHIMHGDSCPAHCMRRASSMQKDVFGRKKERGAMMGSGWIAHICCITRVYECVFDGVKTEVLTETKHLSNN